MLLVEGSSETGLFRHLSNHIFSVRNCGNTKAMRVILFFKTWKISGRFRKLQQNFEKNFSVSEIIPSELVSQTGLFRHLSDYVYWKRNFEKAKSVRVSFFSKCLKFKLDFKTSGENREKVFRFCDNCISIGIIKLPLLRTGYFSLAGNVLTSSTKILDVNKRDFFQLNRLGCDQWIW